MGNAIDRRFPKGRGQGERMGQPLGPKVAREREALIYRVSRPGHVDGPASSGTLRVDRRSATTSAAEIIAFPEPRPSEGEPVEYPEGIESASPLNPLLHPGIPTMAQSPFPVIGFVGPSGSGKTTLLRGLAPILVEYGLRLGYLKHAHHRFDLDRPGKDSYEIRAGGVEQTLLASRERWALQVENRTKGADPDLWEMLGRFDEDRLDLVLVEGFKHAAYPKIEVYRPALPEPPLYPQDPDILAVASDQDLTPRVEGRAPPEVLPLADPQRVADFIRERLRLQMLGLPDPRAELMRYYRWLRRYGYNDSHSGNASVRVGDWFYVTPTGASADRLTPDQLIRCPIEGDCPPGASLDAPLHRAVYHAQPQARALLHSHGAFSVGVSLAGHDFEPIDFEGRYYFDRVPVISIVYDRYAAEAPAKVAHSLAHHPIAMVRGHGVYAWGETLDLAYKWTCSLELSAKISVIARRVAQ